jgi:hypothetical protein
MRSPFSRDDIIPIPLREDLTVFVQGLPIDMTREEAAKVAAVILAFANIPEAVGSTNPAPVAGETKDMERIR